MENGAARNDGQVESHTDIVKRILAGDQNAFALLMRRYNPRLYRPARNI
jgi:DNA-binding GntR family transcriptional regulator